MEVEGAPITSAQIIAAASVGLLYYDYFLTLSREIQWVWLGSHQVSWASAFFFANRYISFFGYMPMIYEFFSFRNDESRIPICTALRSYREILILITQCLVSFFLIAQTYALWNRNRVVLWILVATAAAVITYTIIIYAMTHHYFYDDHPSSIARYTCLFRISDDRSYKMLSAWIGVFIFDGLIFSLSVAKVVQYAKRERPPILWLLLRDGVIYFAIVSMGCLAVVLSFWPRVIVFDEYSRGGAEIILNSLSSTLASRLFLNLRDPTLNGAPQNRFSEDTRFAFYPNHDEGDGIGGESALAGGLARRFGFGKREGSRQNEHALTMTVQLRTLGYTENYGTIETMTAGVEEIAQSPRGTDSSHSPP